LGSELVANATDWTDSNSDGLADNWSDQYSGKLDYSIVTGNGFTGNAQRFEVNDVAGNDRAIRTSATVFTSSKLYKVSFKYRASISSGSILVMDGGSGATVTNITTHTGDAKLFETYYVAPTGSHLWFYMQNADSNAFMEIDEVSIKEIFNDIVAYYPLDGSSSANGVTQDVTTGEVLGDELITDGEFTDENNWNVGAGVSFVNGQAVWSTSGTIELKQDITINSGKLYKVVLDIDSRTNGTIRNNVGSYGAEFTTSGIKTEYITGSGAKFYLVGFTGFDGALNSVSVKEVLSNTGVLK